MFFGCVECMMTFCSGGLALFFPPRSDIFSIGVFFYDFELPQTKNCGNGQVENIEFSFLIYCMVHGIIFRRVSMIVSL